MHQTTLSQKFILILILFALFLSFQVFDNSQDGKRQQTAANVSKHSNDATRLEETIGHIAKDMGERTSQEAQRLLSEAVVSFLADLVRFSCMLSSFQSILICTRVLYDSLLNYFSLLLHDYDFFLYRLPNVL